jgi:nucleoid DNA-binding protein
LKTEEEKIIGELKNLTDLKESEIASVFKHFSNMLCIGNYYNGEDITIPYFGTFKLKFEGDNEERKAQVTGFFNLHEDIKRNVGIVEDFRKTGDESNLLDLDCYKLIRDNVRVALKDVGNS